ncbi:MAG: NGG1p interacting factor NIF3 [Candidatus Marinimicrobia bacterium]|nr:NGG1p interacting factor NIF3 [Candidatus Neomarinimicrobiota bacterium]
MYKISFYVPKSHLEQVKNALFNKGAGKYKNYDRCSWQTPGKGQFRPIENADPYLGKLNKLHKIKEYKVELICKNEIIKQVIAELKKVHPYEEVAYDVVEIFDI